MPQQNQPVLLTSLNLPVCRARARSQTLGEGARTLPAGQQLIVRVPGVCPDVGGLWAVLRLVAGPFARWFRTQTSLSWTPTSRPSCSLRWTDGDHGAASNTRLPEQRWRLGKVQLGPVTMRAGEGLLSGRHPVDGGGEAGLSCCLDPTSESGAPPCGAPRPPAQLAVSQ